MYLYYVPWLNLISWFYYHNTPVKERNNLHPQTLGDGRKKKKHKATRKPYQQHQTTRTGTTSSSGSLANTQLSSKGRFDDMQQCFLSACESQSHTIDPREPKRGSGKSGALGCRPGGETTGHLHPRHSSSSASSEIPSVISHLLTSPQLFFCFPAQATAWLLWHSCSHAVW